VTPEIFAEWLRRQGHHVARTVGTYWHSQGPRVYQAFPYHWVVQPAEEELLQFLRESRAIGLRYSTNVDAPEGRVSYHAVYENSKYDLDELGRWARKNVRRGLRNCSVEPISFVLLAEEGWALQCDTLARQGRDLKFVRQDWRRRCQAAADLPGFEAWGALIRGRLAASVTTFQMNDCCYMLYQQCHRDYLAAHVNNALSFVVTQTMLARPRIRSIFYGLHSLDAPTSVDEFKFRMGYKAKPVRQRVVFHPRLTPVVNRTSHGLLRLSMALRPGDTTLSKAEGMMRFYLEGKRPIQEQRFPEPLRGMAFKPVTTRMLMDA
jgi:hypothetical protein